jgi:plastocyanin
MGLVMMFSRRRAVAAFGQVAVLASVVAVSSSPAAEPVAPEQGPSDPPVRATLRGTVTSLPEAAAKRAVVYLQDAPQDRIVNGSMDNQQMALVPDVVVITAQGSVTFTNSDPVPHNAFSPDHETWDIGVIEAKGSKKRTFASPGVYAVLCHLHPNTIGYVVVVPSSYFAKTDETGTFVIGDVPVGTYRAVAWAPGVSPSTRTIKISGNTNVSFELRR